MSVSFFEVTQKIVVAFLLVCLSSSCSKEEKEEKNEIILYDLPEETFSEYMAVFGDIQYYTMNASNVKYYKYSLDWLQAKFERGLKLNCILHTGDITQSNSVSEWIFFYQATSGIAGRIPYFSMIGNHDYRWRGDKYQITNRNDTYFNDYVHFPLSTGKIVAWFEQDRMENIIVENTIQGRPLYLLILEFGPREEVVAWATAYIKSHPEINFILMTHEYLEAGGGRRHSRTTAEKQFVNTSVVTPDQLWTQLIKCNDNIRVVLCGHVGGMYALTVEKNDFGREIYQIQHNIQNVSYRYDNWLMMWEFPKDSDDANVFIFNTKTGQFFENKEVLFTFRYKDPVVSE